MAQGAPPVASCRSPGRCPRAALQRLVVLCPGPWPVGGGGGGVTGRRRPGARGHRAPRRAGQQLGSRRGSDLCGRPADASRRREERPSEAAPRMRASASWAGLTGFQWRPNPGRRWRRGDAPGCVLTRVPAWAARRRPESGVRVCPSPRAAPRAPFPSWGRRLLSSSRL